MRAVYPGTFNPPTIGHVAIVEAALATFPIAELHLVVSRTPLAKEVTPRPTLEHRLAVVAESVAHLGRVSVHATDDQLIADIAGPYDIVVMGADKWAQVLDVGFYDSLEARDAAVRRLPLVAVAPRAGHSVPDGPDVRVLDIDPVLASVSSSAARGGDRAAMSPAARTFDDHTGAWSDAARYDAWVTGSA